jgi:hypothetical protein
VLTEYRYRYLQYGIYSTGIYSTVSTPQSANQVSRFLYIEILHSVKVKARWQVIQKI